MLFYPEPAYINADSLILKFIGHSSTLAEKEFFCHKCKIVLQVRGKGYIPFS